MLSRRRPARYPPPVMSASGALRAIKLLHTVVWACLAVAILSLPVLGVLGWFQWAAVVTGMVLLECLVLAVNHWRCPLTNAAEPFTSDRSDNFDIYLPLWLARNNKRLFGGLFLIGEIVVLVCWFARG